MASKSSRSSKNKEEKDGATLDAAYQKWINQQMEKRAGEYSDINNLNICCGTWNVNTRMLSESCDLKLWLMHQYLSPADIYAISLQEICDLNVVNVVLNSASSDEMALYWEKHIATSLSSAGIEYRLIFTKHMVGLQLMIFIKASVAPRVSDLRHCLVYTGGYGVTGNKGGIAVRFDVDDSPMCFVGSHFHANRENVQTRNLDFQTILDTGVFLPHHHGKAMTLSDHDFRPYSSSFRSTKPHRTMNILYHEYIFWLGDLNYRISTDLEDDEIFTMINAGNWIPLRGKDQLLQEKEKGNVFAQFNEGLISFPPTYKYQPGTDMYDQRPEKKIRAPAWCDRILYHSTNPDDLKLISYDSVKLNISDHKPVAAWFECGIKQFVPDKVRSVYQDLLFAVDKWVNASSPKMQVENRILEFGTVNLDQKYFNTINLRNIGTVMAEWAFVPRPDELCPTKPFLKFFPEDGILAPGESASVKVQLFCTTEIALHQLNEKDLESLEDIAILRLTHGSDFFIVVTAKLDQGNMEDVRKSYRKIIVANPIAQASRQSSQRPKSMFQRKEVIRNATKDDSLDSDDEDQKEHMTLEDIYK